MRELGAAMLLVLGAGGVDSAIAHVAPKGVVIASIVETGGARRVTGRAKTHEQVADFMRAISMLVSTPKGFGRVVERKDGAPTVRIELFDGALVEDFGVREVSGFEAELLRADRRGARVDFEIRVRPK